ncbi:hypothetical protein L6452_30817 [Arctium lappa]|uniref:Uncharacterized protein n=1 Tax=Arctium lappa TaxID=4217 RepID=A0ACB8ZNM3_ARCLA|nr:hypothetical protein L6452_30817 [Arctium lappa]
MIIKQEDNSSEGVKEGNKKVHFLKLFSFADQYDMMLMTIGTLGAIGFGMAQPLMTVIFGQLINSLATTNNSNVADKVSKVCIMYLYLAIGIGIASFLCEVMERMSSDTIIIREAIGEKDTGCMSFIISEMAVRVQASYAQAGNVIEQTVGAIRTVASFNGEKQAIKNYDDKLEIAYSATARQGLASGLGTAVSLLVSNCSYALAIWYGSKLILEKGYNGGEVISIIMAMMFGALHYSNHEELITVPDGAYAQLVQMQSGKFHQAEDAVDVELADIQQTSCHGSSVKRSPANHRSLGDIICFMNMQETGIVSENKEDTTGPERVKSIPIKRIVYLNKPELLVLFLGYVAAVARGVLYPIHGLIMSSAIKIFYEPPNKLRKGSNFWAPLFVGVGVCCFLFVPMQNYFFGVAGGKLIQRIRSLSFRKIVHQEMSWFDKPEHSSGAVGARLATDASTMRNIVGDALALVVQNVAMIVAGLVIAFTANWILALVILVLMPLLSLQGYIQLKFYKSISAGAKAMYEEASQVASDAVGNIRTISSFGAEEKVINLYQKKCEQPIKQAVKSGIVNGVGFGLSSFVLYSSTSFFFYIGSILQQHGRITFREIFRVFFCLSTLSSGLSQSATLLSDLNKARESIVSIFEILDCKPEIDSSIESGTTLDQVKGDVELQHVSFRYPTRPDIQVFRDLSLSIPSGKGKHDELMNISGGVYATLAALQTTSI